MKQVFLPAGPNDLESTQATLSLLSLLIELCERWKIKKLELQNSGVLLPPLNVILLTPSPSQEYYPIKTSTTLHSAVTFPS